jgi:exopolysaccharide biosynthesis polyprenyl glycosylphosphotransferase
MALTTDPVISPRHRRRSVFRRTRAAGGHAGTPTMAAPTPTGIPVGVAGRTAAGWGRRYAFRLVLVDLLGLLVAALVVHLLRFPPGTADGAAGPGSLPYVALTAVIVTAWMFALAWSGSRDPTTIGYGAIEYHRVIQATFAVFGVAAIASYLLKVDLPRSYLLVMMPVGLAALLAARFGGRRWLHRQRDTGRYLSQVLAVGTIDTVTELLHDLRRAPRAGYTVIGVCLGGPQPSGGTGGARPRDIHGVPVLGDLDTVTDVVRSCGADTVAVTSTADFGPSQVRKLSWDLEDTPARLILAPAITNIAGARIHTQPVAGLPLIHVDRPTYRGANRILKRSFDITGGVFLIVVLSPLLLAVAAAIKLTGEGPVFFRQDRVGLNGEVFRMIKFRSMQVDAEARLDQLRDEQRDAGNVVLFKLRNDPRVTSIGRFLRRFSLDELPQLFNVVAGGMSLVGPRPPLRSEVDRYRDDERRRMLVKPGITGLWQVSGRSDLTWQESIQLDMYYVENWSITGDLAILWKTARAVLSSAGAY